MFQRLCKEIAFNISTVLSCSLREEWYVGQIRTLAYFTRALSSSTWRGFESFQVRHRSKLEEATGGRHLFSCLDYWFFFPFLYAVRSFHKNRRSRVYWRLQIYTRMCLHFSELQGKCLFEPFRFTCLSWINGDVCKHFQCRITHCF